MLTPKTTLLLVLLVAVYLLENSFVHVKANPNKQPRPRGGAPINPPSGSPPVGTPDQTTGQTPGGTPGGTTPPGQTPPANGATGPASTTPCTQVDHSVEGLENPSLACLEDYVRSEQSTCPENQRNTTVTGYLGGHNCAITPNVRIQHNMAVCSPNPLPRRGIAYRDQPVSGALYRRVSGGDNGPFIHCNRTALSPSQALRNAKHAIDNRMYYAQCGPLSRWEGFRMDCVGLVSRAWNLAASAVYTVENLSALSTSVDCWDVHPGDIVTSGTTHVGMVHHWVLRDRANPRSSFMTWESASTNLGHIQGSRTMQQIQSSGMSCRRFNCMSDAVEIARPGAPTPPPPPPPPPPGGPQGTPTPGNTPIPPGKN